MLRRLAEFAFLPPVMLSLVTIAPFAIYFSDSLSAQALSLSRQVGLHPQAITYAVVCIIAFIICYTLVHTRTKRVTAPSFYNIKHDGLDHQYRSKLENRAILLVFILAFIGIGVTLYTVRNGNPGYISAIFDRLSQGQQATDLLYGPDGYMRSESVPGALRLLGWFSNAAVISWLALSVTPWFVKRKKLFYIILAILAAINMLRSILGGDRNPALIVFVLIVYDFWIRRKPDRRVGAITKGNSPPISKHIVNIIVFVVCIFIGIAAFDVLSILRGTQHGSQQYNTILMYADLGVANLSLAIDSARGMGYGTAVFLYPLTTITDTLRLGIVWPQYSRDYILGSPANLLTYSYMDFGIFGFIDYMILGYLAGWIQLKAEINIYSAAWRAAQFYVLFALIGVFTVPIFISPGFWLSFFTSVLALSFLEHQFVSQRHLTQNTSSSLHISHKATL